MTVKPFKTISEQLEILRSRGLRIDDEEKARDFLQQNNYYRVSGYSLTLRENDVFYPSASMQNIIDIYNFDRSLRHILLKYLEIIEVELKSIYAYEFSKAFGADGYLDAGNFINTHKYNDIISKAEDQRRQRLPHEAYLKHFDKNNQIVPLWAYVDLLTIADASILYSISLPPIKQSVAAHYHLAASASAPELLGKFMHSMTIIRNLCAHGSRLYNRLFEQKPSLNKKERAMLRKDETGKVDNAHLYGFIIIMSRLLVSNDFDNLKSEIVSLSKSLPFVGMKYYGFNDDWKTAL